MKKSNEHQKPKNTKPKNPKQKSAPPPNRDRIFKDKALYFIPLGGSEQFGVNLNVYISHGDMIAVDCGIGFAGDEFPGIDIHLPDPAFLEEHREHLKAFIITHAHEDHIGALAYLWDRFQVPVYASPFTAAVLHEKLKEKNLKRVPVHVVKPGDTVKIGKFAVKFVPVAHSIPDACSLIVDTPDGRFVHSGDWNLDPHPVVGNGTDSEAFKAAGDQGVLAYIGDSTNAEIPGRAGSESTVAKGLESVFKTCTGRIVVTMFSSNIGRVRSIIKAAKAVDRKVCVVGRSLHKMIGCAVDCGMMKGLPSFVIEEDLAGLPADKTVIIATGSQGEFRAALSKIARGEFRGIKLSRGDTVIYSARAIPGNEKSINAVKNNMSAAGIRILTPRDTKEVIHVSGHPYRDEIIDMWSWIKPQMVIPVHGERMQLDAQAKLATECGVEQTLVPNNGSVVRLAPNGPEIVDMVKTGILAVDQKRILAADHISISDRRKLQFSGVVHVSLLLDSRGDLLAAPKFETVGLVDPRDAEGLDLEDQLNDEILDLFEEMDDAERLDDHFVSEEMRIGIRRFFQHVLGIKPNTTVHVMRV